LPLKSNSRSDPSSDMQDGILVIMLPDAFKHISVDSPACKLSARNAFRDTSSACRDEDDMLSKF
jgi:hypothetical protein